MGWAFPAPKLHKQPALDELTLPKIDVCLPHAELVPQALSALLLLSVADPIKPSALYFLLSPPQSVTQSYAPLPSHHPALTQCCPPTSQLAHPDSQLTHTAFQLTPSNLTFILLPEKTSLNSICIRPTLTPKGKAKSYYPQDEAPTLQLGIASSLQLVPTAP